jgi:hypothetical protein
MFSLPLFASLLFPPIDLDTISAHTAKDLQGRWVIATMTVRKQVRGEKTTAVYAYKPRLSSVSHVARLNGEHDDLKDKEIIVFGQLRVDELPGLQGGPVWTSIAVREGIILKKKSN